MDWAGQWDLVQNYLDHELGHDAVTSWLKPLFVISVEDDTVVMSAPSPFLRDRVHNDFYSALLRGWVSINPNIRTIKLGCYDIKNPATNGQTNKNNAENNHSKADPPAKTSLPSFQDGCVRNAPKPSSNRDGRNGGVDDENVENLSSSLDKNYIFRNFIVGKSNEFAYAAARRVAESSQVFFNPLFLYSGVGLGKTHLMHSIAWEIRQRNPQRKVVYLSAEQFMYRFISALRYKDTVSFKRQYRSVDVLMIDDVQFISGKESTQEEFFHTFNSLVGDGRQIILSADRSPADLDRMDERIRSRLGCGLVADIHPSDYELRLGILQSKVEMATKQNSAIEIDEKIIDFLARRITSNIRELEGALNRLIANAMLIGQRIRFNMLEQLLPDLLRNCVGQISIGDIQEKVAEYFKIRQQELLSARRAREVTRPRQIAMYIAKKFTTASLPEIGRKFGGRDHTTVIHAVRKIEELMQTDPEIRHDVNTLTRCFDH